MERNTYMVLVGKPEGHTRPKHVQHNNIKILKKMDEQT
jgi:hypothetical protein